MLVSEPRRRRSLNRTPWCEATGLRFLSRGAVLPGVARISVAAVLWISLLALSCGGGSSNNSNPPPPPIANTLGMVVDNGPTDPGTGLPVGPATGVFATVTLFHPGTEDGNA